MAKVQAFCVLLLLVNLNEIFCSSDTIRSMASGFIKVLDHCKNELGLNDQIVSDLYHFWKQDYSLLNRDTGCALICMSKRLDLIDTSGRMHHGNTQEFAMKHGASNEVASKVVDIIHGCEKQNEGEQDECLRVLEVAKCFRSGIHQLNWSPTMDVIVDEVLTEI